MVDPKFKAYFPNIPETIRVTSPETPEYNCFAWAAGIVDTWWEPGREWPIDARANWDIAVVVAAFATKGFVECADGGVEAGFEKIVIYCDEDGEPTHAARQLSSGRWTSKLGTMEDIEHDLGDLAGKDPAYGRAQVFLRRAVPSR